MKRFFYFVLAILFVSLFSCQKNSTPENVPDDQDTTNPLPPDSLYLLTRIQQPYEWSVSFKYDSKNRLSSYGRYFSNFDSTVILYNAQDKPVGVARYTPDSFSDHFVLPSIFIYNGNRIEKIILKEKKAAGSYSPSYLTSYGDPMDIRGYDSLVYNAKNQVIKSFFFEINPTIPDTTLWEYKILTWSPLNDSLLQKGESYYRDINNNFNLSYSFTNYSFDNMRNPFYNLVPMYAFVNPRSKTHFWILSYYYSWSVGPGGNNFLTLSKNNSLTNSISSNIAYTYNLDSLLTRSVVGNDELEGVNYIYSKVKK